MSKLEELSGDVDFEDAVGEENTGYAFITFGEYTLNRIFDRDNGVVSITVMNTETGTEEFSEVIFT